MTFILESNMATVTAYHGTRKLERILNDGAVYCWDLAINGHDELAERAYNISIREYEKLTAELAEAIRKKRKEQKGAFNDKWLFQQANGLEEALADVAVSRGYVELDDGSRYTELKRLTHVFLSNYEMVKKYTGNNFKAILEFEIPEELVRPKLFSDSMTLVRKKVDLQYLRRVYVEAPNVEEAKGLLNKYGVRDVEVDVMR